MKLIVLDINNLTDARYFAAWNVDFLALNIDPTAEMFVSPEYFHALQGWIEGPQFIFIPGQEQQRDLEAITKIYSEEGLFLLDEITPEENTHKYYQRINVNTQSTINEIKSQFQKSATGIILDFSKAEINWSDLKQSKLWEFEEWKQLWTDFPIFIHLDLKPEELEEMIQLGIHGICLRGGEEEKIGVKSFDDLDGIFEKLEEIQLNQ